MILDTMIEGLEPGLREKANRLFDLLASCESLVVAFSGGVDSGLLCAMGFAALGERMLAVTVHSPVEAPGDHETAVALAAEVGFRHQVIDFDDLGNPEFIANPADRCYHCKLARFQALIHLFPGTIIAEGSNVDDASDYRPGARAVAELGIRSPLAEAGLGKSDIRALARVLGLSIWDRPSAPCLATRFPYGSPITRQGLLQVARGEAFLQNHGLQPVRVRHYGQTARIEVAPEMLESLIAARSEVLLYFKNIGFTYVVVDMAGYRMGSMNEALRS